MIARPPPLDVADTKTRDIVNGKYALVMETTKRGVPSNQRLHNGRAISLIATVLLCALWGMPPGMVVACGWAPYLCVEL
tara:strand:+ start:429 stop:665 length:237 start_codon:yes stop_codon:yes gene_type:complete